jgi:Carboxypeptidase regulatory-like domain
MKFNSVAIGLLFALFASDFYQSRLQLPLGTVEGTVVDSNGVPVAGAWVEAENTGNTGMQISRALSNRQGMFTIRGLHPGAIRLYAYKANDIHGHPFLTSLGWYGMAVWTVATVQPGQRGTYVKLPLGPTPGVLKLTIEDEQGRPSGGTVHFERKGGFYTMIQPGYSLDRPAKYSLPPDTEFQFKIVKDGYQTWYSKEAPDGPWLKVKSGEVISMTAKLKRSH